MHSETQMALGVKTEFKQRKFTVIYLSSIPIHYSAGNKLSKKNETATLSRLQ
jgi:hypothetical protein